MVTDRQIRRLMSLLQAGQSQQVSADKAGMDRGTARKYRRAGQLPSALRKDHRWRTRSDPFALVCPPHAGVGHFPAPGAAARGPGVGAGGAAERAAGCAAAAGCEGDGAGGLPVAIGAAVTDNVHNTGSPKKTAFSNRLIYSTFGLIMTPCPSHRVIII